MNGDAPPRSRSQTIVLAGVAALLVWLVISRSLAAYLADAAPQLALWLSPQQPEALVNLADRSLNAQVSAGILPADIADDKKTDSSGSPAEIAGGGADKAPAERQINTDGNPAIADSGTADSRSLDQVFDVIDPSRSVDLPAIHAWLVSALMNDPLNARALRILGQTADVAKDEADALKFMQAAARQSLHESVAVYWMMHKSIEAGDYKAAISYADVLLRTDRDLAPYVAPVLVHFAEQKASGDLVKSILVSNPPWRDLFFEYLTGSMTDARTPLGLLLALKSSPTPPTPEEVDGYLDFLITHKFFDLSYYTWLQFLPTEELRSAGMLFNGDFEVAPSGSPFDWVITQGAGVTVDIVPTSNKSDGHALLVDFLYGRVDYHSVRELVLLAPGTYQFDGEYKGQLVGPRGLKWRLVCANEASTPIGESAMINGTAATWKQVGFTFTVPVADCRAQYVRLDLDARMASEQLVTGSMLFDELHISRVTNPPGSAQSNH